MTLSDILHTLPSAALAFSGGADSAYLLWALTQEGVPTAAYFVRTVFQPQFELDDAKRLAGELGAALKILDVDILAEQKITENTVERCYFCKKRLFSAILDAAAEDGYTVLLDGTNASDDAGDRPGMRAIRELQVRSPLREAELTKDEIRRLSREAGLFTWDKPAYACLATRIPTGTPIRAERLAVTEQAEAALAALGFRDFRVRDMGGAARLQICSEQLPLLLEKRRQVTEIMKEGYSAATLDLVMRDE